VGNFSPVSIMLVDGKIITVSSICEAERHLTANGQIGGQRF